MDTTPIDRLHADQQALSEYLSTQAETSFVVTVDDQGRKVLLLAAASYLEALITDIVDRCVRARSNENELVVSFVRAKAISRQYHSYFDWEANNANKFLSMFGGAFKDTVTTAIRQDGALSDGVRAFMELGRVRNEMVHGNFVIFPLEKTTAEIFGLFGKAMRFVRELERHLCA